ARFTIEAGIHSFAAKRKVLAKPESVQMPRPIPRIISELDIVLFRTSLISGLETEKTDETHNT
ncbi:hypothetical protein V7S43_016634, partial [Phytophthora oleae]